MKINTQWNGIDDLIEDMTDKNDHAGAELIRAIANGDLERAEEAWFQWQKRERQGSL